MVHIFFSLKKGGACIQRRLFLYDTTWGFHGIPRPANLQPVREAVSYRGLFTAGWFGVREKHCSWLEIYDRL